LAYRLLMLRGEWDVDAFLSSIPASKWEELKIAKAINDSHDDWLSAVRNGYTKAWQPPNFAPKKKGKGRRRLDGTEY
jgi:hypothetical protein